MKINIDSKELFTDMGQFIKKLDCPYKMQWENLKPNANDNRTRQCNTCDHAIIETAFCTDEELLQMVKSNKDSCFKINLNQDNLKIM